MAAIWTRPRTLPHSHNVNWTRDYNGQSDQCGLPRDQYALTNCTINRCQTSQDTLISPALSALRH